MFKTCTLQSLIRCQYGVVMNSNGVLYLTVYHFNTYHVSDCNVQRAMRTYRHCEMTVKDAGNCQVSEDTLGEVYLML